MRSIRWLTLGLSLAASLAVATTTRAADTSADEAYKVLGDLPVMHNGRIKPFQTLAIEELKQIHGRSSIKQLDAHGEVVKKWGPVEALLDWSAKPDDWNAREFILVDYFPLKHKLLAGRVHDVLNRAAARESTPEATRDALLKVAKIEAPSGEDLKPLVTLNGLADEDRAELLILHEKLAGDNKYLAPDDLNDAEVIVDGKPLSFITWFQEILRKQDMAGDGMGGRRKLEPMEERAAEVASRLLHYEAIRDHNRMGFPTLDLLVVPRPSNDAYLKFTADALEREHQTQGMGNTPLEQNATTTFLTYIKAIPREDRRLPGTDKKFDAGFRDWLTSTAAWVPLRIVLESGEEDLAKAGFPAQKTLAFRKAYLDMEAAESDAPAKLPEATKATVAAARTLGESINSEKYPSAVAMARESHFNRVAPFFHAPEAYGMGVFFLLLSLGLTAGGRAASGPFSRMLYIVGMLSFVSGIGLEVYGFYLRVRISGWAPVTNMYETVIWVAVVCAVIGLVLELFSFKKYPALAGSGIAFLATLLAASVPMLDPGIPTLQPVLRSNYWLTIHVLTIVSSYAAFALAMGLGLLSVGFYLTTHYKRSVSLGRLAWPMLPGIPVLAVGALGIYGSYHGWAHGLLDTNPGYLLSAAIAGMGGATLIIGGFSTLGELANRVPTRVLVGGLVVAALGLIDTAVVFLEIGPPELHTTAAAYVAVIASVLGLATAGLGVLGNLARSSYREAEAELLGEQSLSASANGSAENPYETSHEPAEAALVGSGASVGGGGSKGGKKRRGGSSAASGRPSVADMVRSRSASGSNRSPVDARTIAMQATASRIKPLSNFIYRAMQVGVLLVAAGTILGGVWADYSWGRFWGWDAKEVWALITLLVYLAPLHGRFAGWINTFGLVCSSVVCFLSVLMAWYGVNFVLGVGLHSYGFTEGGGQGIVSAVALSVLAVVLAAWYRRRLSSQVESPEPTPTAA